MVLDYKTTDICNAVLLGTAASIVVLAWYRMCQHSLASYPGPVLAVLSGYYVAYYDLWKRGGLVKQLEKLHQLYGPVVRIGPNQLHFNDPQAFNDIYGTGKKLTKFPPFYDCFNERESPFGFTDPHLAKKRREILLPLFSRRSILKLECVIQHSVDRLVKALSVYSRPKVRPANLHLALHSTTIEIITSYSHANPYKALDYPDFRHPALVAISSTGGAFFLMQHFPFLQPLIFGLPHILKSPEMIAVDRLFKQIEEQISGLLADPSSLENVEHKTIYHHLLRTENGRVPPTRRSLNNEGLVLVAAGTDTVANVCSIGTFYVLNNPQIYSKLIKELQDAWPDKEASVGVQTLEKLPYLTAMIKESLRFSHGVVSPLLRVAEEDTYVAGRLVPAGTVVAMGHTFMHRNPKLFHDPMNFTPERWLDHNPKDLENYLVSFSRGPRMCLGINLAWCELYLIFGNLFRKLQMEVYQTTLHDFDFRAYFTPHYHGQFHVLVKERVD